MIKFNLNISPVWVSGDHPKFDSTEIGEYSKEAREQIKIQINPLSPGQIRELLDKHTDIIIIENQKYNDLIKEITEHADLEGKTRRLLELVTTQTLPTREKLHRIAYNSDIIDLVINNWDGFYTPSEEDETPDISIPCIRENKITLFVAGSYILMGTAIIQMSVELSQKGKLVDLISQEGLEKNLRTSQDGQQSEAEK